MKLNFKKSVGFTHTPKDFGVTPQSKGGFTLIETLVAITIFAFSITALISITATGVFNTNYVKNKLTASYLALEGVELVRNIRDSASQQASWGTILGDPQFLGFCTSVDNCFIDADVGASAFVPESCGGECQYLNYRPSSARFNYDTPGLIDNPPSIFRRTISIQNVNSDEVLVISKVEWNQGTKIYEVDFSMNLLNWIGT